MTGSNMASFVLGLFLFMFTQIIGDALPMTETTVQNESVHSLPSMISKIDVINLNLNENTDGVSGRKKREITRLRYKDCGKSHRAIRFDQLSVRPIPIQIPGVLDLRIMANVTKKLPSSLHVRVVMKKKLDANWWPLPCVAGYGSCRYKHLKTCVLTQEVFGCPIQSGYHNIEQMFLINDPGDFFISQMLEGEYKAIIRARDPRQRKELACLVAHFSLKNQAVPPRRA